jgi:ATP-binding cassette subfamily C (CFTR/MRP) protein 1
VTGAIFRKSLRLSGRARLDHSVGQITTMISTDIARLDMSAAFAHQYVTILLTVDGRMAHPQ